MGVTSQLDDILTHIHVVPPNTKYIAKGGENETLGMTEAIK